MKKTTIILFACLGVLYIKAQSLDDSKVPAAVKTSFVKKYPSVDKVKWEKENGDYEASYKLEGVLHSATFKPDGTFVDSEAAIDIKDLPPKVLEYLKSKYKGIPVKEAAKITKANGEINYEAAVKGKDLVFDSTGRLVNEEKE